MSERVNFYSYVPPPGENISVSIETFLVDDLVTTEDEDEWAVKQLSNHPSWGPSGMRAEHTKRWLAEAKNKESEEAVSEKKVVTEGMTIVLGREGRGG